MSPRERPQQPPSLESEGVPDLQGALPEKEATGDGQEGVAPPGNAPGASVDWGVTAEEQRRGEPLDLRLAREEPDLPTSDGEGELAGRLVAPDGGAGGRDTEGTEIANAFDDEADLSAEEAAVHVRETGS